MLLACDMHNLVHRCFRAMEKSVDSDEKQSSKVVIAAISDAVRQFKPREILCAFECRGEGFRKAICAEYKANRDPVPEALEWQLCETRWYLEDHGARCVSMDGYEADDLIASAVCKGKKAVILSNDKDLRQVLFDGQRTILRSYNLREGQRHPQWFTAKSLREEWGIAPEQVVDWQCLVGDGTDNIKGAENIGPKRATALLREHGTLDSVFGKLDSGLSVGGKAVTDKGKESLRELQCRIDTVRQLVTLRRDLQVEVGACPTEIPLRWVGGR